MCHGGVVAKSAGQGEGGGCVIWGFIAAFVQSQWRVDAETLMAPSNLYNGIIALAKLRSGPGDQQPIRRHQRLPHITRNIAERLQIALHPRPSHFGGVAALLSAVPVALFDDNNFLLHAWRG